MLAAKPAEANELRDTVKAAQRAAMERVLGKRAAERIATEIDSPQIIGGSIAPDGKWRAQVALVAASISDSFLAHFCGGSVLAARWVLTAAHCLETVSDPSRVEVLAGTQSLSSGGVRHKIAAIYMHPDYNDRTLDFDIALIKLETPMSGVTRNIVLPRRHIRRPVFPGRRVYVTGWGNTSTTASSSPKQLHEVQVPYVSRTTCNQPDSYNGKVTRRMICAGFKAGGKDSCQGDSGGPLVFRHHNSWRLQIGIVSWGFGCAQPDLYGVYTDTSYFHRWIKRTMRKN